MAHERHEKELLVLKIGTKRFLEDNSKMVPAITFRFFKLDLCDIGYVLRLSSENRSNLKLNA